jgi:hypothetical protein
MVMRKGLGKNKGSGYYNILPSHDHRVHSLSSRGIKQPQRLGNFKIGDKVKVRYIKGATPFESKIKEIHTYPYNDKVFILQIPNSKNEFVVTSKKMMTKSGKGGKEEWQKESSDFLTEDRANESYTEFMKRRAKKKYDVYLGDDGSLDTIVSVEGHDIRFDSEYASQFRNKKGEMTKAGWKRLKQAAIDAYEDEVAYGVTHSYGGKKSEAQWLKEQIKTLNEEIYELEDTETIGEERDDIDLQISQLRDEAENLEYQLKELKEEKNKGGKASMNDFLTDAKLAIHNYKQTIDYSRLPKFEKERLLKAEAKLKKLNTFSSTNAEVNQLLKTPEVAASLGLVGVGVVMPASDIITLPLAAVGFTRGVYKRVGVYNKNKEANLARVKEDFPHLSPTEQKQLAIRMTLNQDMKGGKQITYDQAVNVARKQAINSVGGIKKWNKLRRFSQDQIESAFLEDLDIKGGKGAKTKIKDVMTESEAEKAYREELAFGTINTKDTPSYENFNEYKKMLEDMGVKLKGGKGLTSAERHNRMMDKIFEKARKQPSSLNKYYWRKGKVVKRLKGGKVIKVQKGTSPKFKNKGIEILVQESFNKGDNWNSLPYTRYSVLKDGKQIDGMDDSSPKLKSSSIASLLQRNKIKSEPTIFKR